MSMLSWLGAFFATPSYPGDRSSNKRVSPRHRTKKGPGRTGCTPKIGHKVKRVPGVPSGIETGIGVNGIRGASGGGRLQADACTTLCKRKLRAKSRAGWLRVMGR